MQHEQFQIYVQVSIYQFINQQKCTACLISMLDQNSNVMLNTNDVYKSWFNHIVLLLFILLSMSQ